MTGSARPAGPARGSLATGLILALVSAATFSTAGPLARMLMDTGWTPGAVVLARMGGAAVILLVPAAWSLRDQWRLLLRGARVILTFGLVAVAGAQIFFYYAVARLSVGVALMLEYLALVLVVLWQWGRSGVRPRPLTLLGIVLAVVGLVLILDAFSSARVDPVGVAYALAAAVCLATYFVISSQEHDESLPPLALAGGGVLVGTIAFVLAGAVGVIPVRFADTSVIAAGASVPWWVAVVALAVLAGAASYVTGIAANRVLGARLGSFVGLFEVLFAVLFAWWLLAELPRPVQILGGLCILGGVIAVRLDPDPPQVSGPGPVGEGAPDPAATLTARTGGRAPRRSGRRPAGSGG